jgi:hypothetical protein
MPLPSLSVSMPVASPYVAPSASKKVAAHPPAHAPLGRDHFVRTPRKAEPELAPDAEIVMADLPLGAVELALAGKPVKLVISTGGSLDLAISGSVGNYEMTLGDSHIKASTDPVGLERVLRLALNSPATLREALRGVALNDRGAQLELAGPNGVNERLSLAATSRTGARTTYGVESPQACFAISAAPERDVALDVGRLAGLLAEQPQVLRGALVTVGVEAGASPVDEVWASTFQRPGFSAGGTASNGVVTYWHAPEVLDEGIFEHEFGHAVAQHFTLDGSFTPAGWDAAVKNDGKSISEYGNSNSAEDFAESWRVFSGARVGRPTASGDPATLEEFVARFPNRAKIIQAIASGERAPLVPFAATCARGPAPTQLPAVAH